MVDRADRVRTVDQDKAIVDCGPEGTAVEIRSDAVEAAKEPVPAFVVVFAAGCHVWASWWELLAVDPTGVANLLSCVSWRPVSEGVVRSYKWSEAPSIIWHGVVLVELEPPRRVTFSSSCSSQPWWLACLKDVLEVLRDSAEDVGVKFVDSAG